MSGLSNGVHPDDSSSHLRTPSRLLRSNVSDQDTWPCTCRVNCFSYSCDCPSQQADYTISACPRHADVPITSGGMLSEPYLEHRRQLISRGRRIWPRQVLGRSLVLADDCAMHGGPDWSEDEDDDDDENENSSAVMQAAYTSALVIAALNAETAERVAALNAARLRMTSEEREIHDAEARRQAELPGSDEVSMTSEEIREEEREDIARGEAYENEANGDDEASQESESEEEL